MERLLGSFHPEFPDGNYLVFSNFKAAEFMQ